MKLRIFAFAILAILVISLSSSSLYSTKPKVSSAASSVSNPCGLGEMGFFYPSYPNVTGTAGYCWYEYPLLANLGHQAGTLGVDFAGITPSEELGYPGMVAFGMAFPGGSFSYPFKVYYKGHLVASGSNVFSEGSVESLDGIHSVFIDSYVETESHEICTPILGCFSYDTLPVTQGIQAQIYDQRKVSGTCPESPVPTDLSPCLKITWAYDAKLSATASIVNSSTYPFADSYAGWAIYAYNGTNTKLGTEIEVHENHYELTCSTSNTTACEVYDFKDDNSTLLSSPSGGLEFTSGATIYLDAQVVGSLYAGGGSLTNPVRVGASLLITDPPAFNVVSTSPDVKLGPWASSNVSTVSVKLSNSSGSVAPGNSIATNATITGRAQTVNMTYDALNNVTVSFAANQTTDSLAGVTDLATITVSPEVLAGTYYVEITGTGQDLQQSSAIFKLTVT